MRPWHHFSSRFQAKIPTNLQKSLRKHPKPPSKKNQKTSTFLKTDFLLENSFFKSRPHMAAQADPQSGTCSYIDLLSVILSSKTGLYDQQTDLHPVLLISTPVLPEKALFHLEQFWIISGGTYSLLRWVRHHSKIRSKTTL